MPVSRLEELKELARLKLDCPNGAHNVGTVLKSGLRITWAFSQEDLVTLLAEFAEEEETQSTETTLPPATLRITEAEGQQ